MTQTLALVDLIVAQVVANLLWSSADRVEDRLDRRESVIDRRVDHGLADVVEDRIDAVESRLDRRNLAVLPRFDRYERRMIRFRVGTH